MTWDTFNCNVNRDVIGSYRCFIVDPDRTLLTAEFEYGRAFSNINITLAVYIRRGKSKIFRKTLIIQVDYCEISLNQLRNKIANMAYKSITRNSNFPKKCPVPKVIVSLFYLNVKLDISLYLVCYSGPLLFSQHKRIGTYSAFFPSYFF